MEQQIFSYQFVNKDIQSLLTITDVGEHKEAFTNIVRGLFPTIEGNAQINHLSIRQLIVQMEHHNWNFLEFLLNFEKEVKCIMKEQKHPLNALVPIASSFHKKARDSLKKWTRKRINYISLQILELLQNFRIAGDDSSSQSLAISALWPERTLRDAEMTEMKRLLSLCIQNISAEDRLFLDLSGQNFISLREEVFSTILTSGGQVEDLFKKNEKEEGIKALEYSIGALLQKEFSFAVASGSRDRILRFLEDYYASPLPRLVAPVPVTEEQSTLLSLPESVAAVLVDANVIDGLVELEIEDNIKKRLRSKGEGGGRKGGGGGGGGGRKGGGGGGGRRKKKSKKEKTIEIEDDVTSAVEEDSNDEAQAESVDAEDDSDTPIKESDAPPTAIIMDDYDYEQDEFATVKTNEKPDAPSRSCIYFDDEEEEFVSEKPHVEEDDEEESLSELEIPPFMPDQGTESDIEEAVTKEIVTNVQTSAPTFSDKFEFLEFIYKSLNKEFSLDEIIDALDASDDDDPEELLTEEIMDLTADYNSQTPIEPTMSTIVKPGLVLGSSTAAVKPTVDTNSLTEQQPTPVLGSSNADVLPTIDNKSQTPIDSTIFSPEKVELLVGSPTPASFLPAIDMKSQTPVEHRSVTQTSLPAEVADDQPPQHSLPVAKEPPYKPVDGTKEPPYKPPYKVVNTKVIWGKVGLLIIH